MAKHAVKENRYLPYEAKLDAHGATYGYVASVPLADITRYPDAQARIRIAGSSTIGQYAEQMKQGEVFPPLVLGDDGSPDFMLLDGNTRKFAYEKLSRTHTDAYIVTGITGNDAAIYLSGLFNSIGPVPLTRDEILRMIRAGKANGMADSRIAKDLGVKPTFINRLVTIDRFDARATGLGLTTDIPADTKSALAPVADDSVLRSLLDLTLDADLKGKDVRTIVKEIAGQGSEADRLKVVSDERTDRAPSIQAVATGRTTTAPPSKDSLMAFGRIHSLMGKFPNPDLWVPVRQDTRDDWYPKLQDIEAFLGGLVQSYQNAGITP